MPEAKHANEIPNIIEYIKATHHRRGFGVAIIWRLGVHVLHLRNGGFTDIGGRYIRIKGTNKATREEYTEKGDAGDTQAGVLVESAWHGPE